MRPAGNILCRKRGRIRQPSEVSAKMRKMKPILAVVHVYFSFT
jgi:hypothetical protein